ncbi:hypothetical protein CERSUDRAFT_95663 [Gelatoporia subvermispora B]|uniref:Aldehyde dehydrogenase n=1 Tax=Ceriporiopsis subvermispora (strain B) TaxID=914234 RepID=M2QW48_CERS8|nr:hypothetical protein CERSUDRAFT_95663 [Gelatoporia subvermispora B]
MAALLTYSSPQEIREVLVGHYTKRFSPVNGAIQIYSRLSTTFRSGKTRAIPYRRHQLLQLARLAKDNLTKLEDAVAEDLGRPRFESGTDTSAIIGEALRVAEHIEEWAQPTKPQVEAWRSSWDTTVYNVPKGLVLIISPWNYPFYLNLMPLIGAISAGCTAVLKPSEMAPASAKLLAELIPRYLDADACAVVNGGPEETTILLDMKWDHIFFTGGTRIGRIVASAAAKHLTPVTLELGGKSPVIVDGEFDLKLAAKRILYGKFLNCGQLCITPDYVLIPRDRADDLVDALKEAYHSFFPDNPLSKGELFGPILPIVPVDNLDEAVQFVAERPSPLVVYAFTNGELLKGRLLETTQSGTLALNDTITQLMVHEAPFGGKGDSGYGAYFGKDSFDTFTHRRPYVQIPSEIEPLFAMRYRPYTDEAYATMVSGPKAVIPEA